MNSTVNSTLLYLCLVVFFLLFASYEREYILAHDNSIEIIEIIENINEQIDEMKKDTFNDSELSIQVGEAIKADLSRKKNKDVVKVGEPIEQFASLSDFNEIDLTPRERY